MVVPVFVHETIGRIQGAVRIVSLPGANDASIYTSIYDTLEYNASLFFVPWNVAASYVSDVDVVPSIPQSITDFDKLTKRLGL